MVGKNKGIWVSTNIRVALINEVKKLLQTDTAKKEGLTNVSQFIDSAIRDLIEKIESERLKHVNMYDDHVKIMDNRLGELGRIVSVYFKKEGGPWCDYCKKPDCIHVQYAWEIADVRKILGKYGFSPPPSRI